MSRATDPWTACLAAEMALRAQHQRTAAALAQSQHQAAAHGTDPREELQGVLGSDEVRIGRQILQGAR